MPQITLRKKTDVSSPSDLKVTVQDRTFEYLMNAINPEIRISAFLDEDVAQVDADYVDVFVGEDCPYRSTITKIIPGSKTRTGIALPAEMKAGEQLTIIVTRSRTDV
ncbi:MAG: hypothetical protein H7301_09470 [Cryobacterium sp.]|nr:hypothetical protein [Oligoflexia bacterium]